MKFQQIRSATTIITYGGKRFLTDPWLSDKGAMPPVPSPYNNLPNPLVELPVSIDKIIDVDAVIVTHMHHFDHFDEVAHKVLPKNMPIFTQSESESNDMRKLGFTDVTALTENGTEFDGITLIKTPAAHGIGETAELNYADFGMPGDAMGVVLKDSSEKTLYIAGDTVWFDGVEETIAKYKPEMIVLNAAHASFPDNTPILMGAEDLYLVVKAAPDATIIASHMDSVNHARLSRKELKEYIIEKGIEAKVIIPDDGETLTF